MALKRGSTSGKNKTAESSPSLSELDPHTSRAQLEGISRDAAKALNLGEMYGMPAKDNSAAPVETLTKSAATVHSEVKQQGAKSMSGQSVIEYANELVTQEAPPPLPIGEYPAEVVGAEVKTSGKGNDYLALTFRIHPDSYPADYENGNPDGEVLTYNRLVTADSPQARYRMRKAMEAMGGPTGSKIDPNELMGLTATIGVRHSTYEGETRAEIAKITAA